MAWTDCKTVLHRGPCGQLLIFPMSSSDPLSLFLPPVQEWFRAALGEPTAAQRQGWPAIAAGQHTLILAPTGSGKTLTAFLYALDRLTAAPPVEDRACRT